MQGHIRSILPQKGGVAPVDNNTAAIFNYESSAYDSIQGSSHAGQRKAFYFNGTSYAKVLPSSSLDVTDGLTISAWVKSESISSYQHVFCKGTGVFSLNIYQSKVYLKAEIGGAIRRLSSQQTLQSNRWYHLAMSYAQGELSIYIDGILDAKDTYGASDTITVNNREMLIGAEHPSSPTNFLRGLLSELQIWRRRLSAEEIQSVKNGKRDSRDLVGCWYPTEENGPVLFDASASSNDALVEGSISIKEGNAVFNKNSYGLLLEEGTSNLIPSNAVKFETLWSSYFGAAVTRTQNVTVPEWGTKDGTRIQTVGGTSEIKSHIDLLSQSAIAEGRIFAVQVKVKNIGEKTVRVHPNRGSTYLTDYLIPPGQAIHVKWVTNSAPTGTGGNLQIQFRALEAEDNLDFIAYEPQIEEKNYSTSFVDGTREGHFLRYPNPIKGESVFTASCWVKIENMNGPLHNVLAISPETEQSLSGLYIDGYADKWRAFTYDNSGSVKIAYSTRTVQKGEWIFLAATRGGGRLTLYIDGEQVEDVADSATLTLGDTISVGQRMGVSNNKAYMAINELRIDKVRRTPEEIRAWYHVKKERFS